ncbi:helix-turn-helix domain-containing protein [Lysinibacillus capsici]|uniref:helix-turn-helix domain-containing protein n=1 Tax=Lysinibacillus capsici TaxID=2115968 RepID=UPI0034E61C3A
MIKINLRSILKERGIKLTDLSKITGISLKALSAFQNQKTDGVQYNTLDKISAALDLEIGEIIRHVQLIFKMEIALILETLSNSKYIYKAELILTDNFDNTYISSTSFKISLNKDDELSKLEVTILQFDRTNLPLLLNNQITKEFTGETNAEFLYIVSHLIVQELMSIDTLKDFNIQDTVIVSWKNLIPAFIIENVNLDTIQSENERITFIEREHKVNLVPLDPNTELLPHVPNLDIPYTPNIESLKSLPMVYEIKINDGNFKRDVYITLD